MYNAVTVIKKKRNNGALSAGEIEFMVNGLSQGKVTDYQMSAFLMSVYFRGMNAAETAALTKCMLKSGMEFDLSHLKAPKIDKHSTGGVGDKTSIVLAPLLACFDVIVPMISGRGLGHTGGTADKLESIPGFNINLSTDRFLELLGSTGVALIAQTDEICPADKHIYALRDVSGTIESVPLIVASIMSKKLAEGFDGLVLDVKTGSGAFMKDSKDALRLAKALVTAGKQAGKQVRALITDMSQPLGRMVGNSNEINECVSFLRRGPEDKEIEPRLYQVTMELAAEMLIMARKVQGKKLSLPKAKQELKEMLLSGRPYAKLLELISLQGGDTSALDDGLALAPKSGTVKASRKGFVSKMDTEEIGMTLVELGGGRKSIGDTIDHQVGFEFLKQLGQPVKKGEGLVTVYAQTDEQLKFALGSLKSAISIGTRRSSVPRLIRKRI